MRSVTPRTRWIESDESMSLEWASLGRLVRRRTFEALALRFARQGVDEEAGSAIQESDRTILRSDR